MASPKKYRVIVAKPCVYGVGKPEFLAAQLRDAGFEVIYLDLEEDYRTRIAELSREDVIETGIQQTREAIANAALRQDADAVYFPVHRAYDMDIYLETLDLLKKIGMKNVLVFGSGLIHPEEAELLSKHGIGRIFGPGTTTHEVVEYLRDELPRRMKT